MRAKYGGDGGGLLSFPDNGSNLKSSNLRNDVSIAEVTEVSISFRFFLRNSIPGKT